VKVKKISEELRRNREQFIKERKAIEEANRRRKPIPQFISQKRKESVEYASFDSSNETSSKTNMPFGSGKQLGVEYIPTPIPKKRPSSLMNALEELNEGFSASSSLKSRRTEVKIPRVARLNPSLSLGGQMECEGPRNDHKGVLSDSAIPPNSVCSNTVASAKSSSLRRCVYSSVPIRRTTPKAKAPVQKARDTSKQKVASKHKLTRPSISSLSNSPDLKTAQTSVRPASQPPSSNYANGSRSLGIAAQLGLARSRIEPGSLPRSLTKTSNDNLNSISKGFSPSDAKSSLRSAELPFNGQRKPPARTEPSFQQPRLQPRAAMERSRVVVPALRGIAAQYGSLPVAVDGRSPNAYVNDESDEYASDDSFIDDTDCTSAKDYLRAVKDIHKSLHFDPNKYAKISKYDDLASMESSYRQIEKEEKLSMRLGAREDQEDMAMEAERRRRRMAKRGADPSLSSLSRMTTKSGTPHCSTL
ncbi:hypothetical protein TSMEX_002347, partial [Taenia solium]